MRAIEIARMAGLSLRGRVGIEDEDEGVVDAREADVGAREMKGSGFGGRVGGCGIEEVGLFSSDRFLVARGRRVLYCS